MRERIVNSFEPHDLKAIYYEARPDILRYVQVPVVIVKEIRTKTGPAFFELIPMVIGSNGHWENAEKQLGFLGYAPENSHHELWIKIFAKKINELRETASFDEHLTDKEKEEFKAPPLTPKLDKLNRK